jgi:hypothetical protein
MAFLEGLDIFQSEEEFKRKVEKSTLGEADEYLRRAIEAGDRGIASLSPLEMAVVKKHHGEEVFAGDDEEPANAKPETEEEKREREAQYPTDK